MLKNRITYALALLTLLLLVILNEGDLTYMALYAVLTLPLLSLGLALILRRRFIITEHLAQDNIVKGDNVKYIFHVKNNSFLPCQAVHVRFKADSAAIESDFAEHSFDIWPFKGYELAFNLTAKYRGNYEIGVERIIFYDFLGLFKFEQKHGEKFILTVLPRVVDVRPLPHQLASTGARDTKNHWTQEDYSLISDLRKYQPTDGYKKIHWKASAKKNELISKNFQNTKENSVAFVLDNSEIDLDDQNNAAALEDLMMESLVSHLASFSKKRYICSLHYMGYESGLTKGPFEYLYNIAAKIHFGIYNEFDQYLTDFAKMKVDAENVILLVQYVSAAVFETVQSLKSFGNHVVLLYFNKPDEDEYKRISQLRQVNIYCQLIISL